MDTATARFRNILRTTDGAQPAWGRPMLWCALVMMVAMLSFYVHLLNEQVQRGDSLRQAQRVAPDRKMAAAAKPQPGAIRVSQNTAR